MKLREERPLPTAKRWIPSRVASEEAVQCRTEPGDFPRNTPTEQESMTVAVQTEARGDAQRPVGREIPGYDRSDIVRGVVQAETIAVTEPAVHLHASDEFFT